MVPLALLGAGLVALAGRGRPARAAEVPYAGTWKVTLFANVRELNFWLVKFEGEDDKVRGSVVATLPQFKGLKLEGLKADASSVRFTLQSGAQSFRLVAYVPKGKGKPKALLGALATSGRYLPVRLEPTEDTKLDPKTAARPVEGLAEAKEAFESEDAKERDKKLKALLVKYAGKPVSYPLAEAMVQLKTKDKAPADEVRPFVEQFVKYAEAFGREVSLDAHFQMARTLARSDKTAALGLEHARKAGALVRERDPATQSVAVFKALSSALKKAGKADEAKTVDGRVAKLTERANQERLEEARAAVKALSEDDDPRQRLFRLRQLASALKKVGKADEAKEVEGQAAKLRVQTNKESLKEAQEKFEDLDEKTPPQVRETVLKALATALRKNGMADKAKQIDAQVAKLKSQLDKEFVKDAVPFEPKAFAGRKGKSDRVVVVELFTGAQCPPCVAADIAFDALLKTFKPGEAVLLQYHLHIPRPDPLTNPDTEARGQEYYEDDLEGCPTYFVDGKVTDSMGGAKFHGKDRYEKLSKLVADRLEAPAQGKVKVAVERKGDKIDLKADVSDLAAVGENVRLRFVLMEEVVAYAGGNKQRLHHHVVRAMPGGPVGFALKGKTATQTASVDLAALRKTLTDYLVKYDEEQGEFPNDDRPMAFQKLKVVALIQDDDTRQILQAVQVDVPEAAK
jgi:hypothetical protein